MILMKKKTADAEGNDDIEEAFQVFDTKNDGYVYDMITWKNIHHIPCLQGDLC